MNGIIAVGYFLFSLVFSVLSLVLWVRIALRYFRISSLHPVSQVVHRITDPLIQPFARFIPTANARRNRYDWPCFLLLVLIEVLKYTLISTLFFKIRFSFIWLILYPLADLIIQPLNFLFYAILLRVIMSWVNPMWQHPIHDLLIDVTEPALRNARRYVPHIAGFDFSPMVALIVIKMISLFISASLPFYLI